MNLPQLVPSNTHAGVLHAIADNQRLAIAVCIDEFAISSHGSWKRNCETDVHVQVMDLGSKIRAATE